MSVSADSDGAVPLGTTGAGAAVQIIIEMDERLDGWRALVDVGGLKRVLLNLLGNALKVSTEICRLSTVLTIGDSSRRREASRSWSTSLCRLSFRQRQAYI